MAQHFLLSAAQTLSFKAIFRMSDGEAHAAFVAVHVTGKVRPILAGSAAA